jgi:hypothetical protein
LTKRKPNCASGLGFASFLLNSVNLQMRVDVAKQTQYAKEHSITELKKILSRLLWLP